MTDLPKPHPSAYADPLEASDKQTAIGVVAETDRLAMAIGDETSEEWIRFEGEAMDAEP